MTNVTEVSPSETKAWDSDCIASLGSRLYGQRRTSYDRTSTSFNSFVGSRNESFELKSLNTSDAASWTSSDSEEFNPHAFETVRIWTLAWCDVCAGIIWSLYETGALRCTSCQLTCHSRCRLLVRLACVSPVTTVDPIQISEWTDNCRAKLDSDYDSVKSDEVADSDMDSCHDYSEIAITIRSASTSTGLDQFSCNSFDSDDHLTTATSRLSLDVPAASTLTFSDSEEANILTDCAEVPDFTAAVELYNILFNDSTVGGQRCFLTHLSDTDPPFAVGFLRITFQLQRPVNVESKSHSVYDLTVLDESFEPSQLTSFHLTPNAMRTIYVTSRMTSRQVVKTLLTKFHIVDSPHKFGLYEVIKGHDHLVRLSDNQCPLDMALRRLALGGDKLMQLVLQENDPGEVQWHYFTETELSNFLALLDREESSQKAAIVERYSAIKAMIQRYSCNFAD